MGFVDSGLPEGDPPPPLPEGCFALEPLEVPTEALVRVIREFKPHVMTTYDENGGYPHPDHVRCHEVSMAAYEAAGDYRLYPDAGTPWNVAKLYYNHGFLRQRMQLLQDEFRSTARRAPSPNGSSTGIRTTTVIKRVTTRIECSKYFTKRDEALLAHATQIDPSELLLHHADGMATKTLADRGIRARPVAGADQPARDRSVRRDRAQR